MCDLLNSFNMYKLIVEQIQRQCYWFYHFAMEENIKISVIKFRQFIFHKIKYFTK